MPSMNDSSEPGKRRITRRPSTGSSASEWASESSAATPVALSFAPGTTGLRPMSAMAAA